MATDNSSFFSSIDTPNDGDRQFICSGRYADCYRANIRGKWLFVKVLKREYADNERCIQAFRKEQELGMIIDHPNIVRYQLIADDNAIWQDYVDGLSLDKFIEQNPEYFHKSEDRRKFVGELLSAVGYLHSHQIIHLDLKPQNIIITTQGNNVKLVDLGMAFHDTFTSTFGGTEGFSAPEIMSGNEAKPTFAADIYSIGRLMETVGIRQRGIIRRCTKEEPTERYQDVEEVSRAFRIGKRKRMAIVAMMAIAILVIIGISLMPKQVEEVKEEAPVVVEKRQVEADSIPKQVKEEKEEAKPKKVEEKQKHAVAELDSADFKMLAYAKKMNAAAEKQQNDMKERYAQLNKEKARIYAPLEKMIENPDYGNESLYSKFLETLESCHREMQSVEKRIDEEKGRHYWGGFSSMARYDYKAKIDSVNREAIKRRTK